MAIDLNDATVYFFENDRSIGRKLSQEPQLRGDVRSSAETNKRGRRANGGGCWRRKQIDGKDLLDLERTRCELEGLYMGRKVRWRRDAIVIRVVSIGRRSTRSYRKVVSLTLLL